MSSRKTVAIACQGGGSHAAFTAGVLQTLLLEEAAGDYDIIGFSGTSGGALSALLAWYGLLTSGPETSVRLLQDLWRDNAAASPYEQIQNAWTLAAVRAPVEIKGSPYEFPLAWAVSQQRALAQLQARWGGWGPREVFVDLQCLLEKHVPFAPDPAPRKVIVPHPPVRPTRLVIGAVDVISGEFEAFDSESATGPADDGGFDSGGISLEAVLASAALPQIFRAVRIGDRAYWDGLFSQNPPIRDFVAGESVRTADHKPDEIWVIQINQQSGQEPSTPYEIEDRRNELAGNLSLNQEIRAIRTMNNTMREIVNARAAEASDQASAPVEVAGRDRPSYKPVAVHRLKMDRGRLGREAGRPLDAASKLDRSAGFIDALMAHGQDRAREFVTAWHDGSLTSET
ncbi:MAG: patatin-like phospholipase family protein [Dehalococcoidia bacterium]